MSKKKREIAEKMLGDGAGRREINGWFDQYATMLRSGDKEGCVGRVTAAMRSFEYQPGQSTFDMMGK